MQINIQDDFEPDFYQFIVAVPNWLNLHPEADRASDLPWIGITMKSNIKPLVSILTPAWNRSAYLEKVWAGLDAQVYSEIEWIVANDGSTDDTAKVCLELKRKSRFPVTIIEANLRVGKPRMDNELIKAAKGDFLIWCDSDEG